MVVAAGTAVAMLYRCSRRGPVDGKAALHGGPASSPAARQQGAQWEQGDSKAAKTKAPAGKKKRRYAGSGKEGAGAAQGADAASSDGVGQSASLSASSPAETKSRSPSNDDAREVQWQIHDLVRKGEKAARPALIARQLKAGESLDLPRLLQLAGAVLGVLEGTALHYESAERCLDLLGIDFEALCRNLDALEPPDKFSAAYQQWDRIRKDLARFAPYARFVQQQREKADDKFLADERRALRGPVRAEARAAGSAPAAVPEAVRRMDDKTPISVPDFGALATTLIRRHRVPGVIMPNGEIILGHPGGPHYHVIPPDKIVCKTKAGSHSSVKTQGHWFALPSRLADVERCETVRSIAQFMQDPTAMHDRVRIAALAVSLGGQA
jgi:hypothetical protein